MPSEGPKQQRKSAGSLFPSFPEFQGLLSRKSSRANLRHLAVELCKAGLQHGPLGEELGQATQKRGGAYSHECSGSMTYLVMSGWEAGRFLEYMGAREVEALSTLKSKCFMSPTFILCYTHLSLSGSGLSG